MQVTFNVSEITLLLRKAKAVKGKDYLNTIIFNFSDNSGILFTQSTSGRRFWGQFGCKVSYKKDELLQNFSFDIDLILEFFNYLYTQQVVEITCTYTKTQLKANTEVAKFVLACINTEDIVALPVGLPEWKEKISLPNFLEKISKAIPFLSNDETQSFSSIHIQSGVCIGFDTGCLAIVNNVAINGTFLLPLPNIAPCFNFEKDIADITYSIDILKNTLFLRGSNWVYECTLDVRQYPNINNVIATIHPKSSIVVDKNALESVLQGIDIVASNTDNCLELQIINDIFTIALTGQKGEVNSSIPFTCIEGTIEETIFDIPYQNFSKVLKQIVDDTIIICFVEGGQCIIVKDIGGEAVYYLMGLKRWE